MAKKIDMGRIRHGALAVLFLASFAYGAREFGMLGELDARAATEPAALQIDYPIDGSIFPPEITAPVILWRDGSDAATAWELEVRFADGTAPLKVHSKGELMQMGKSDPEAGPEPVPTAEQLATHSWQPGAEQWRSIKQHSQSGWAVLEIRGYAGSGAMVSAGSVRIETSKDEVGAPIFYRDVPLKSTPSGEMGSIQPLPQSALPLIKWQVRNVGEAESYVVMEKLHTCSNCHSFAANGKSFGMDLDGPRNDKGLYALAPVARQMAIRSQDVIRWSSFQVDPGARSFDSSVKRFGFMSQLSPDGRYVVTSIGPPNAGSEHQGEIPVFAKGLLDRLYSTNYKDYHFLQVFYPTRGILAYYDSVRKELRSLPGADDPAYVQTSAFWSPDGKYLIFSRARAQDPYPKGAPKPEFANDAREPQIQYDLYRIPFNEGRGGVAEPVRGASGNGMSNNFPKVSPDGRWIVFVENKNGLLMRPDSKLYIVPFEGGAARPLRANTALMNSWHSFSPNGHWLVFSSKARTPYTRLMLTHIDEAGNDSPAILLENTTAANRAANIPEFVNVAPDGLSHIEPEAAEQFRLLDESLESYARHDLPGAIAALQRAIELDPGDGASHYHMGILLKADHRLHEAIGEYEKAVAIEGRNSIYHEQLGLALAENRKMAEAERELRQAIAVQPSLPKYEGELAEVLAARGDYQGAVRELKLAVEITPHRSSVYLEQLAEMEFKAGSREDAVQSGYAALDLAVEAGDRKSEDRLMDALARYGDATAHAR